SSRRLVWLAVNPTPYNNFLFDGLHEQFHEQFEVHFAFSSKKESPWISVKNDKLWKHSYEKSLVGVDWRLVWRILRDRNSMVVIAGWNEPTNRVLLLLLAFMGRKYVVWTDTPRTDGSLKY